MVFDFVDNYLFDLVFHPSLREVEDVSQAHNLFLNSYLSAVGQLQLVFRLVRRSSTT